MMAREPKPESVNHTEGRHARLKAESERLAKEADLADANEAEKVAAQDRKASNSEERFLKEQAALLQPGETREMLLERVRQMREDRPAETYGPPPPSEYMKKQIEIEQEAGRQAVKAAEEEYERNKEAREAAAADIRKREGTMQEVHHPNPGMEEQFPANKATLGKTK